MIRQTKLENDNGSDIQHFRAYLKTDNSDIELDSNNANFSFDETIDRIDIFNGTATVSVPHNEAVQQLKNYLSYSIDDVRHQAINDNFDCFKFVSYLGRGFLSGELTRGFWFRSMGSGAWFLQIFRAYCEITGRWNSKPLN